MIAKHKRKLFIISYLAGLVIVVGLVFVGMEYLIKQAAAKSLQQKARLISENMVTSIQSIGDILYGARATFTDPDQINEQTLQNFAYDQNLFDRYSDLQTISLIELVTKDQKQAYLKKVQADSMLKFGPQLNSVVSNNQEVAALATYIVNDTTHGDKADYPGTNLYSTPERRATFDHATSSGTPTMTPPVDLIINTVPTGNRGFFITLPLYTNNGNVFGFINTVFVMDKLVNRLIGDQLKSQDLGLKIEDITDAKPSLAYQSANYESITWRPIYAVTVVNVVNRKWQMTYKASTASQLSTASKLAPFLAAGTVLLLLLQPQLIRRLRRKTVKGSIQSIEASHPNQSLRRKNPKNFRADK